MSTNHTSRNFAVTSGLLQSRVVSAFLRLGFGLALALICAIPAAHAQTTWSGNTNTTFATGTNWLGGTAPSGGGKGIGLGPAAVTNTTLNLAAADTVGNIVFDSNQAYTFTGSALTITPTSGNGTIILGNTGSIDFTTAGVTLGAELNIQTTAGNTSTLTIASTLTTANKAIYFNGTGTGRVDITSSFSGTGTVTQQSSGTLILAGLNTYSGATTLDSGTLDLNAGTAANTTGSAIGTSALTIAGGNIDNTSGSAVDLGTNKAQTWSGSFGFTGTGNLNMGTGAVTLSSNVTITTGAATVGTNLTEGGIISGAFALAESGTGSLALSGHSTYTKGFTLNSGTLDINTAGTAASGALGNGGAFTINGGNIDNTSGAAITVAGTNTQTWNGNFGYAGTNSLTMGTGAVTLGANVNINTGGTGTLTEAGAIGGAFALSENGTGILVLTGASGYTKGFTLDSGTLGIGTAGTATSGALGNGGTFTINGGNIDNQSAANLTVASNNVQSWNGNFGFTGTHSLNLGTGAVTLGNNVTITTGAATAGSNLTIGGAIGGAFSLSENGAGTLDLATANTFSGNMNLEAGTLVLGSTTSLQDAVLNYTGGTLTFPATSSTLGGLAGTQNIALASAFALTLTPAAATDVTYSGILSGTTATLKLNGTGIETLSGNNTYTGGTTLDSGTLNINNGYISNTTGSSIGTGTLTIAGGNIDNTSGGALTLGTNNAQTWSGNFGFTGTNSLSMGTGVVTLGASINITTGGTGTLTEAGAITGAHALAENGTGILALSGNSTYSGGMTLMSGTLDINNGYTSNITGSSLGSGTFTIYGGNIDNTSGGALTLGTNNVQAWDGNFGFTGTNSLNLGTGAVTMANNTTITTGGAGTNALTIGGAIGGGTFSLTENGTGNLVLSGANTYTGNTNLEAGRLTIGTATTLQNSVVNVTGGTVNFGALTSATFGGLGGTQNVALPTNLALTLNTSATTDVTYSGALSGTGASVTKTGTGEEVFSGTNTYGGATNVNAGILDLASSGAVNGSNGTTVASGATLQLDNGVTVGSATNALTISGTGVGGNGALVAGANDSGNATWNGNITLAANATIGSGSASGNQLNIGNLTFLTTASPQDINAANLTIGANTLTFVGGANTTTWVDSNMIGTGNVVIDTSGIVHYYFNYNDVTGTTFVDVGTLILDTSGITVPQASGNTELGINGNLVIGDGLGAPLSAVVQLGPDGADSDNSNEVIADNTNITVNQDGYFDLNGQDQEIGFLTMNGATISSNGSYDSSTTYGALTLASNVSVLGNGNSSVINGNLTLANSVGNVTTGFNVTSGGNTSGDLIINAIVSGGGIYKTGNGTMVMTNNQNQYTGQTEINAGTLNIQASGALGASGNLAEGTVVDNGGQLQVQNNIDVASENLTLNGNGTNNNGALENVSGNNTWGGPVYIASNSGINTNGGTLVVSGNIANSGSNYTLTQFGSGATTYSGNVGGGLSLVMNGTSTLTLNGSAGNTFNGSVTINSGTLAMAKTGGVLAISGNVVTINTGGTLLNEGNEQINNSANVTFNGGTWNTNNYNETVNSMTLTGNSDLVLGNTSSTSKVTFAIGANATSWTAGDTLYIYDWSGNLIGGTAGNLTDYSTTADQTQIFYGTSLGGLGLNLNSGSGNINGMLEGTPDIVFVDPNAPGLAAGDYEATILADGEIVPILPAPEPATYAAGASLGLMVLLREWRRRRAKAPVPSVI